MPACLPIMPCPVSSFIGQNPSTLKIVVYKLKLIVIAAAVVEMLVLITVLVKTAAGKVVT